MKKIFFVLSIVLAFVGCNDDDSDFLGKDNYITEFSLQKMVNFGVDELQKLMILF